MGSMLPNRTASLAVVASIGLVAVVLIATWAADVVERPQREIRRQARTAQANTRDFELRIRHGSGGPETVLKPEFLHGLGGRSKRSELDWDIYIGGEPDFTSREHAAAVSMWARLQAELWPDVDAGNGRGEYCCDRLRLCVVPDVGFVLGDELDPYRESGRAQRTDWGIELRGANPATKPLRSSCLIPIRYAACDLLFPATDLQELSGAMEASAVWFPLAPWVDRSSWFRSSSAPVVLPIGDELELPPAYRRALKEGLEVRVLELGRIQDIEQGWRSASMALDGGSAEGLFVGLRLRHTREDWGTFEAVIEEVEEHRSRGCAVHLGTSGPTIEPGWVLRSRRTW